VKELREPKKGLELELDQELVLVLVVERVLDLEELEHHRYSYLRQKEMKPQDVYLQRPEFAKFKYENFRSNLCNLRKDIIAKKASAVSESASLAKYRRAHPKEALNHRGEPRWDDSEAERLLRLDMDEGKHRTMKPSELRQTRHQYLAYPKTVFRGHIDQEERRRKYIVYLKKKQQKKHREFSFESP
jgi:hypothetical protein